jgi:hypothetical protein
VSNNGLRATGAVIALFFAGFFALGALLMITHPNFSPMGWIGVVLMGVFAGFVWESTKKIGGGS